MSSTREPWWLQYLKSLLLKIVFVTTWSVFQNQVTYVVNTWELFKRSFTHGATTYTGELTQVGHYIANP